MAAQPCAAADRCRPNGQRSRPGSSSAPSCSKRCWPTSTGRPSSSRDGRLPAALVAGNPEFLRPLVGVEPPGGAHLRFYAVDVGRGAGRPLVGAGRPHPGAVGRRLSRWRTGSRCRAPCRTSIASFGSSALAPFFQAFQAELSGFNRQDDSPRLRADARAAERDLFRARLSRPLSRLPAGRGRGPDRRATTACSSARSPGLKRAEVLLRRLDADFCRSAGAQRRARGSASPAWCRRCATARW